MWIVLSVAAVLAALAVLFFYLLYRFRLPLPRITGKVAAAGLKGRVEIIRDRWGVPHIYADNLEDLFFAQGYVQAQDRLWQMELNRRLGLGSLSEIFGEAALAADRFVRTVGIRRAAENDLACLSADNRLLLDAYLAGVNRYIGDNPRRRPLELILLGLRPEAWKPLDTLAWTRMQSWQLSANWDTELINAALIGRLGPERAARLHGAYPEDNPVILPDQSVAAMAAEVLKSFRQAEKWFSACALKGMSNSWAVSGRKSVTGNALFAYDPHLGLHTPSIWHECHLICPELEVAGATFPGVPGVIVGHNRHISFGFTTSFSDVQDIYLERFNTEDPGEYEYRGKWEKAQKIVEEIRVRGEKLPRRLEILVTRHGPVVNDLIRFPGFPGGCGFSLRWAGREAVDPLQALLQMNRAGNWSEFCKAMAAWDSPSQNALYADSKGNIGYALTGRVPIRRRGKGLVPVPGWSGDYEWSGWVPWEEMPRVYNPERGYLVTANNQPAGREHSAYIGYGTANGNRAARIEELLRRREKLSLQDLADIQTDLRSKPAERFVSLLGSLSGAILEQEALAPVRNQAVKALELLRSWDCVMSARSAPAAIYGVSEYFAKRRVYEPWLGDLLDVVMGTGAHVMSSTSLYMEYSHLVLYEILCEEDELWLKTPEGGMRRPAEVLALALKDALSYLSQGWGPDPGRWRYGDFHQAYFTHPIGSRKPFNLIFGTRPVPCGGNVDTVWQCAPLLRIPPGRGGSYSASWRQLIDLSDWDRCLAVHAPGQSGHPASRHYRDLLPLWIKGKYHPLLWARERVEANAEGRLVLEPAISPAPST